MAKKKKTSKKDEKKEFNYSVELIGLLLIVIGIVGVGFGIVGAMVKQFAMFLVGEFWWAILALLLFMGFYMLIKRKLPSFFSSKLVGLYIFILVVLVMAHAGFIKNYAPKDIINQTITNYNSRIDSFKSGSSVFTSGQSSINVGGGIIGAGCAYALTSLFGKIGTIVVLFALVLFAIVMLFDVDLGEAIVNFKHKLDERRALRESEEDEEEDEDEENNDEEDVAVSISDDEIPMLKNKPEVNPANLAAELDNKNMDLTMTMKIPEMTSASTKGFYTLPSINLLDEVPKSKE